MDGVVSGKGIIASGWAGDGEGKSRSRIHELTCMSQSHRQHR